MRHRALPLPYLLGLLCLLRLLRLLGLLGLQAKGIEAALLACTDSAAIIFNVSHMRSGPACLRVIWL